MVDILNDSVSNNNTVHEVDNLFQTLIRKGTDIFKGFQAEQAIKPKHISIISNWINQALGLIEPAIPPDSEEFKQLCNIRARYSNATCVLPGDTNLDLSKTLELLNTAYEYFKVWWDFDWSEMDPVERASTCHAMLKELWKFARSEFIGSLKGKENGRTKRTALLHSYGRMYMWIHSMVQLGGGDNKGDVAEHCHALAGCLRAVYEIFLDINLLSKDIINNGVERFFSFEETHRFRMAKNSLQLHKEFNHLTQNQIESMKPVLHCGERVNHIIQLWGKPKKGKPKPPSHWTGKPVIERAKDLGREFVRIYQHIYHYCNWSIHSGYSEFLVADRDRALLFATHVYNMANEILLRSTDVLIKELDFLRNKGYESKLEKVSLYGAHLIWRAAVKTQSDKR
jgi:hypothetical protein